jgi:signal peptidase I
LSEATRRLLFALGSRGPVSVRLPAEKTPEVPGEPGGRSGSLLDLVLILALCLIFMFGVVRPFAVEALRIPSESMVPTLEVGDRVLVNKFIYRFEDIGRGDLTLFEGHDGEATIKRVVGLPGDRIAVRDGVLFVNGESRKESYVDYRLADSTFFGPEKVPEGHVFVMGDNRTNSRDSRDLGPVPEKDVLGKVFLRLWPPDRAGIP